MRSPRYMNSKKFVRNFVCVLSCASKILTDNGARRLRALGMYTHTRRERFASEFGTCSFLARAPVI